MLEKISNLFADSKKQTLVALISGGVWAAVMIFVWLVIMKGGEKVDFATFLGRFHVLVVHVPIGLLCIAAIMELLGLIKGWEKIRENTLTLLWFGVIAAIVATIMGYLWYAGDQKKGAPLGDLNLHYWTGLGVVVLSVFCLVLKIKDCCPKVYLASMVANVVLISVSSHFGGNSVHGADFLTEKAPEPIKPALEFMMGHSSSHEEEEEKATDINDWLIYEDIVQPIFDQKCIECHDANKIEGDLRMDTFEHLKKGGEMVELGDIDSEWVTGDAEASELYFRVTTDEDCDLFMPPNAKEEEKMTADEIALMAWWINVDGGNTMKVGEVADAKKDDNINRILAELQKQAEADH